MSDLLMKLFMIALYLFEGVFIQRLFRRLHSRDGALENGVNMLSA